MPQSFFLVISRPNDSIDLEQSGYMDRDPEESRVRDKIFIQLLVLSVTQSRSSGG